MSLAEVSRLSGLFCIPRDVSQDFTGKWERMAQESSWQRCIIAASPTIAQKAAMAPEGALKATLGWRCQGLLCEDASQKAREDTPECNTAARAQKR